MTTSPIDPNRLLLTGENPFIRLSETENGTVTTDASFWRILFSPGGPGHVLYIQSELTDNQPRIYSDNISMARWLQQEIQGSINPIFGNLETPVAEAEFESSGDLRSYWTESVWSSDEDIALTWYDLGEPYLSHSFPGNMPQRPHGVCTVMVPANGTRVTLNGRVAKGQAFPTERGGRKHSTCCLAFSESWMLPY